jgi:cellulose 1,4-beta-cellobiosidase
MHVPTLFAALSAAGMASAARFNMAPAPWRRDEGSFHDLPREVQASSEPLWTRKVESFPQVNHRRARRAPGTNPFEGRTLTANPSYAAKLESVYDFFEEEGDEENAAKVRTVQDLGTFFWISQIASLPDIDDAITAARAAKNATGEDQIVGLVVYNLPDRDCSGEESSGELESDKDGLERYKTEYITPYAEKLAAASDLTFAVVVEPDAIGNIVTNTNVPFCAQAAPVYEAGIGYAIASLQFEHVNLYIDASHGGWLGWADNLEPCKSSINPTMAN